MTDTFKQVVTRLLRDKIAPAAEHRDVWSVCEDVVPQLPATLRDKLAVEMLAREYFKAGSGDPEITDIKFFKKPRRNKRVKVQLSELQQLELDAELAAIDRRLWASIDKAVSNFKQAIRLEVTAELLAETFTLEDGSCVSWGEATALQHRAASMESQMNAAEQLRSASRHEAAIDILKQAGAERLADCVDLAA